MPQSGCKRHQLPEETKTAMQDYQSEAPKRRQQMGLRPAASATDEPRPRMATAEESAKTIRVGSVQPGSGTCTAHQAHPTMLPRA